MTIFIVAVLHDEEKRSRTWGFYKTFEDAERAVIENHTDIFELGYYNLAVIEEMPEGVMAVAERTWWYRAVYPPEASQPVVHSIKTPPQFEQHFNFTF